MLHPDEKFFEGEEREGFYIESRMKRYWASQIEALEEIKRICKKHNIRYFAEWGGRFLEQYDIKGLYHGMMI